MGDHIGQQLGNYRLLRLVGQGSFADVYLGEHIHLGTQAAIKVLQVRLGANSIQNFLNEARTIAHLVHPYIIRVLDFGVQGTIPFLVMDYAPKGTFRQRFLQGKPLPPAPLVSYMRQTAAALQYAHDRKLVHRDVKPENMLMGPNDEVLLTDFGFALIPQSSTSRSLTEETAGTAAYMAPEQLQGKPRPTSDQYALGIISYEWLCGSRPFDGSFFEIASQHVLTPVTPMRDRIPTIPREIEKVVMKALDKNPQERYPSVRDFALALEDACLLAKQYDFDLPSSDALGKQSTTSNTSKTTQERPTSSTNHEDLRNNTFSRSNFSNGQTEQTQSWQTSMYGFPAPEKKQSAYENFMSSQSSPTNESKSSSNPSLSFGPINRPNKKTTLQKQSANDIPFKEYMAQFPLDDIQFRPNDDIQFRPNDDITMPPQAKPEQPPRIPSSIRPLSTQQLSQLDAPDPRSQKLNSGIYPFSRDQFLPADTTALSNQTTRSGVFRTSDLQSSSPGVPPVRSQQFPNPEQPPLKQSTRSDTSINLSTTQLSSFKSPIHDAQQTRSNITAYGITPTPLITGKLVPSISISTLETPGAQEITRNTFTAPNTPNRKSIWTNKVIIFVVLCFIIVTSSMFFFLANTAKPQSTADPNAAHNNNGLSQKNSILHVQLTATAQASATATSAFNATATTRNNMNPYPPNTGVLDMDDALTNNNAHIWSENTNCQFTPDGYQVSANMKQSSTCFATNTDYKNFTYEVHIKFLKAGTEFSSAGVTFRGDHSINQFYRFGVYASGRYKLEICTGNEELCSTISDGQVAPPITAYNPGTNGLNQSNVLAIEAIDNTVTIYINNQQAIHPIQLPLNKTMSGMIGVFANGGIDGETQVLFDSARIWAQ